jgi:hypothetical protein
VRAFRPVIASARIGRCIIMHVTAEKELTDTRVG